MIEDYSIRGQIPRLRPRSCDSKNGGCARDDILFWVPVYSLQGFGVAGIWIRSTRDVKRWKFGLHRVAIRSNIEVDSRDGEMKTGATIGL